MSAKLFRDSFVTVAMIVGGAFAALLVAYLVLVIAWRLMLSGLYPHGDSILPRLAPRARTEATALLRPHGIVEVSTGGLVIGNDDEIMFETSGVDAAGEPHDLQIFWTITNVSSGQKWRATMVSIDDKLIDLSPATSPAVRPRR